MTAIDDKEFANRIEDLADRAKMLFDSITTEEGTKQGLVVPMFDALGYDVWDPREFCPEFVADVGIKKGEKVDYTILSDGEPEILVECKSCKMSLETHMSQLFRYYGTTSAKFGILTNGIQYQFYTDLDNPNRMDQVPFLEVDLFHLTPAAVKELKKFSKTSFDKDAIFTRAEELKHTRLIKNYLEREYDDPSDDFVKYILDETYSGRKTKAVVDRYRPLVKRSFQSFIEEKVSKRLAKALDDSNDEQEQASEPVVEEEAPKIVTTDDEMEAYYIIRGILAEVVPPEMVTYQDHQSYFSVLYDDKATRWICHIRFDGNRKSLEIPLEEKAFSKSWKDTGKYTIDKLEDIYRYSDMLKAVVQNYL